MKSKKVREKSQIIITLLGAIGILVIAFVSYRVIKSTIVDREKENITSVARISASDLEASLKSRSERMYAALSGDMANEQYIEQSLFKLQEKGKYIPEDALEGCRDWETDCCEKAGNRPGEVYVGPISETAAGEHVIYMTKAVYMNRSLAGYVQIELNLNEIYEEEQALSQLNIGNQSYCIVKDMSGNTVMGERRSEGEIALSGNSDSGSEVVWSYQVQPGVPKRIQKLVGYEPVRFGNEQMILCVVEDYDEVIKPIDRIVLYLLLLGCALLLWICIFGYRIIMQRKEEEKLKLELAHEKELNAANHALENQENLMQKYNHSKTMTVLTGALAHEFNNLMTPMVLYSELLSENEVVMHEMPEEIQELKVSAERCEELARQLLDYSRQGRLEKVLTNYNATFAVQSSLGIVKRVFPENIRLETTVCKTSYYICGQIGTLNQIILNLVTNAIHAIGDSKGVIHVSFGLSTESDRKVRLVVEDNGPGIPEDVQRHIFEPFYSTKKEKEGSGIGLTVVQRLVGEHGGTIRVKSKEGKGTTFIIDFPRVDEDAKKPC